MELNKAPQDKKRLSAVESYRRRYQQRRFPWIAYSLSAVGILLSLVLIFVFQYFFLGRQ